MPRSSQPLAKRSKKARAGMVAMSGYAEIHLRCACCHLPAHKAYGPDRMLDVHHIAGRNGKDCHDHRNLLVLCRRCHDQFHFGGRFDDITGDRLPELTAGMILRCKAEVDGLDEGLICALKGWVAFPETWTPTPLPTVYLQERERNWTA